MGGLTVADHLARLSMVNRGLTRASTGLNGQTSTFRDKQELVGRKWPTAASTATLIQPSSHGRSLTRYGYQLRVDDYQIMAMVIG